MTGTKIKDLTTDQKQKIRHLKCTGCCNDCVLYFYPFCGQSIVRNGHCYDRPFCDIEICKGRISKIEKEKVI